MENQTYDLQHENQSIQDAIIPETTPTNDTLKQIKHHFSKLGLMFFLGTLIIYLVQIVSMVCATIINPALLEDTTTSTLITMLPMYLIAMPLMILLIKTVPVSQKIEQKNMSIGQWIICFIICYGGVYITNYIGVFLTSVIGTLKGSPVTNVINNVVTGSALWSNFLIMVILAPIMEEIIFRKLLIDRIIPYGDGIAILFSGLMFGLFHGNLNQFVYAFALGICYAFIYVKTGKTIYTILLHMLNNFVGSILGMLILNYMGDEFLNSSSDVSALMAYAQNHMSQLVVYMIYCFLLFAIAMAGIILFFVKLNKIRAQLLPGEITIPKGKRFRTTIFNPGMMLFFIFWIIMIICTLFV